MSASSVLNQMSPCRTLLPSFTNVNRFAPLMRADSPDPQPERCHANSFKQKLQEGNSYAEIAATNRGSGYANQNPAPEPSRGDKQWAGELGIEIIKVESLVEKFVSDASQPGIDPNLIPIFGILYEYLKGISGVQIFAKIAGKRTTMEGNFVNLGAISKRPRQAAQPTEGSQKPSDNNTLRVEAAGQNYRSGSGADAKTGSRNGFTRVHQL
jgi:hypothetical protein